MIKLESRNNSLKKSKAAILVLATALIIVVVTIVSVAIDLNYIYASKEQIRQTAKFLSLAAIEQYFSIDCSKDKTDKTSAECEADREEQVRKRIQEIIPKSLLLHKETFQLNQEIYNQEVNVKYETGRWVIENDPSFADQNCPGNKEKPCFIATTNSAEINSFKIAISYNWALAARLTRSILSLTNKRITVDAVSTVTPRRACILVDTSPSLTRESHLLRNRGSFNGSNYDSADFDHAAEFGFYVKSDNPPSSGMASQHDRKWNGYIPSTFEVDIIMNSLYPDSNAPPTAKQRQDLIDQLSYPGISNYIRPVSGDFSKTKHYENDYILKKTLSDEDYVKSEDFNFHPDPTESESYKARGSWYRIDNLTDPEPLNTVFHGLKELVTQFKERAVSGDKLCLIFYDDTLSWPRIVKLTDDLDYLLKLVDLDDKSEVSTDQRNPDTVSNPDFRSTKGRERIIKHKLFPTINSFSDSIAAFQEAFKQLSQISENGILTSDFIVHIGDGLSNCTNFANKVDNGQIIPSLAGMNWGFCNFSTASCSNDSATYMCSINMLKQLIKNEAVPRNIPVHVVQIGNDVAPHTVDIPDPKDSNKCLRGDAEVRGSGLTENFVMGTDGDGNTLYYDYNFSEYSNWVWINPKLSTSFSSMSEEKPFYLASKFMFDIALMTKGIWAPIRPKSNNCNTEEGRAIDKQCIYTDPPTRRTKDPFCRTTNEQIEEYMKLVMDQNPFVIVDVD